jgi:enamine deaminase RidA (YjgF/YER057c/UK114 family)
MTKQVFVPDHPAFRPQPGPTIFERFEYSAAVRAGDLVFVAGQIGLNPDGSLPPDDATQIENAFVRLRLCLESAGATMADLVELVSYHVGLQNQLAVFCEIKSRHVPAPFPAWTILEVAGLARPGLTIEIKAVAALTKPARA